MHGLRQTIEKGTLCVAEGAFRGYAGILLARNSRERVMVLLDILGRPVRTQLAVCQLERN